MDLYQKKQRWKIFLLLIAVLIIAASLWYTDTLVKRIAYEEKSKARLWAKAISERAELVRYTRQLFDEIRLEERKKSELWAKGVKKLISIDNSNEDISFIFEVIQNNETVPVILTDENDRIISHRNIGNDPSKDTLREVFKVMKKQQSPIEIKLGQGKKNLLYYKDSRIFSELKAVMDNLIESFISEIVVNSASVPVIYMDSTSNRIIAFGNLEKDSSKIDTSFLKQRALEMAESTDPITIQLEEGEKHVVYYEQSFLLTQLKYYPYVQFGVIGIFLIIAYTIFSTSRRAEQNRVWVGMAKETAHQLGTPLSSLMAWMELLRSQETDEKLLKEMEQDVNRLHMIADRFSKIGSVPKMEELKLSTILEEFIVYMKKRVSSKVHFEVDMEEGLMASVNRPLFEWVLENLIKNAVDAMEGEGNIIIKAWQEGDKTKLDFSDSGKGMSKSKYKSVFQPGFTSKKRGWGLGLTLTKRIIEDYHNGKIFVKSSEIGKGTTFRLELMR